jgi:hypothetical protein
MSDANMYGAWQLCKCEIQSLSLTTAGRCAVCGGVPFVRITINAGELDGQALIETNNLACGFVVTPHPDLRFIAGKGQRT